MGSFSADIGKWCEKTKLAPGLVVRKLGFDGLRGVMLKSPVDTGRFRASWRIGINVIDLTAEPIRNAKDKAGHGNVDPQGFATGNKLVGKVKWGDVVYITNNVPYAEALERGHSKQAPGPGGILALTFDELKAGLDAAIKSVK